MKDLGLSIGGYYIGRRPVNNSDQNYIGGYTTISGGISYHYKLDGVPYTVRVTGDNLSNKNAWAAAGSSLLGVTAPRLIKFSLSGSF